MGMLSNHELSKIKKRLWFFTIRERGTATGLEKHVVEQLEGFASGHQDTSWAINSRYGCSDGVAASRVVISMRNPCTMLSLKKVFGNPECRLDLNKKSIWSFLSCDGRFEKDLILTSENWSWSDAGFLKDSDPEESQHQPVINIKVDNLFVITDEEGKRAILEILKDSLSR